jgi:hypothetical protein
MLSTQAAAPSSPGGGRGPASGKAYEEAFASVRKRLAERVATAGAAFDWQTHVDSYLALPAPERSSRLAADPHGQCLELALALAERAASTPAGSRAEACELADLSLSVVDRVLQQGMVTGEPGALAVALDTAATAWTVHAEAALLDDDRERADLALLTARLLADNGSGDPLVAGAVAMAQAFSQWVAGDLEGTTAHLDRAVALYRQVGESRRMALALLRKVMLLEGAGRTEDARRTLGRVVELSRSGLLSDDARELLEHLLQELGEG